jgi:hypothetical protein
MYQVGMNKMLPLYRQSGGEISLSGFGAMSVCSLQLVRRLIGKEISTHAVIWSDAFRVEDHVDMAASPNWTDLNIEVHTKSFNVIIMPISLMNSWAVLTSDGRSR